MRKLTTEQRDWLIRKFYDYPRNRGGEVKYFIWGSSDWIEEILNDCTEDEADNSSCEELK